MTLPGRELLRGFAPSGFFVLRTPLLPINAWRACGALVTAASAIARDDDALADAISADRMCARRHLVALLARPEVREAIAVASPALDAALAGWMADPESGRGARVARALTRYLARAATRPTPFGLFATWTTGHIANKTVLTIPALDGARRFSRLDTSYLARLTEALARDPVVRATLTYVRNATIVHVAGRVHYVERRRDGEGRSYHLVALDVDDPLRRTLDKAASGATIDALTVAAQDGDPDVTVDEARGYVDTLIDNQVLVTDLEPPMTGPDAGRQLVSDLAQHPTTRDFAQTLAAAVDELAAIDRLPLGAATGRYRAFPRLLSSLPAPVDPSKLLHVELMRPGGVVTLGPDAVALLSRGVALLHRIALPPADDELSRFTRRFVERYAQRPVPLLEALDEDGGLGYGGERPGSIAAEEPWTTVRWGARERRMLARVTESQVEGGHEWALTESDLVALESDRRLPLPDAFAVVGTFFTTPGRNARPELRLLLEGTTGPSGASVFGRFCHADKRLCDHTEAHLRAEEALQPDAVFAEIVHLPEDRTGNVVARPALRRWDLVLHGRSGVPGDRRIPVSDLLLAREDDRLVLRSRRLGCRVIPRLTSAHNFTQRTLGVYRFLCQMQFSGTASKLEWDWGPLVGSTFLPRVSCGPIVLARARWRLGKDMLERLARMAATQQLRTVQAWRHSRSWPRFVCVEDGDNLLPIDLDDTSSVDVLVNLVKGRSEVVISEMLPDPDGLVAEGADGRYAHEVVVPFLRQHPRGRDWGISVAAPAEGGEFGSPVVPQVPALARIFVPGTEWMTVKVYAGPAAIDRILTKVIAGPVRAAMASGALDRWFFVRYNDPEWHLRLRLHGNPERLTREVQPALEDRWISMVSEGLVWRVQLDTYERETERFGGEAGVLLAEEMFHADSEAVMAILERVPAGDEGQRERWLFALRSVDQLLADLGLDLEWRRAVVARCREACPPVGGFTTIVRQELARRLRQDQNDIESALDRTRDALLSPLNPGFEALDARSRAVDSVVRRWRRLEEAGRVYLPLSDVAISLVHMHVNRLLPVARTQEPVLYDLLGRVYASMEARSRRRSEPR